MVKFSREYEASIIPEWKAAFVDYKCLKKLIKRIKVARRDAGPPPPPPPPLLAAASGGGGGYGFSVFDPVRALTARFAASTTAASPVRACAPRLSLASCTCVTGGRVSAVLTDARVCVCVCVYAFGRRARRMMDWSRIRGSSCEPRTSM
jgi:hypothetical protein